MKTLLTLCTAMFFLTSWHAFATQTKLHNTPEQCEAQARLICFKHIKHHTKYEFCLREIYGICIHQYVV